ncbi:hypothetical protein Pelo_8486 [Pelomyxa schiedti]|nr:hypothetical protein Pelo_8486 [Pelomyxa schiedti]
MEHSYQRNTFVTAFEFLLTPEGPAHMSRCVWAGDYADREPGLSRNPDRNLYDMADADTLEQPPARSTAAYRYIVNHSKRQYVDKRGADIHPLPLLLAEGNGRGGGDFEGSNQKMVGAWARDVISVEKTAPVGFTKLEWELEEHHWYIETYYDLFLGEHALVQKQVVISSTRLRK